MQFSDEELAEALRNAETDEMLKGAIELHYHGYPEIHKDVKARIEDAEVLRIAHSFGMRGIVIKSNFWPTMGRVYHLQGYAAKEGLSVEAFSSITLNSTSGGVDPWVVEAAAAQGVKVVWMPTWESAHNMTRGGTLNRMMTTWFPTLKGKAGITVFSKSGELLEDVKTIIKLTKKLDLVLCTGHLSPDESLSIAGEAEAVGLSKLVFTHPLSGSVGATREQILEMAKRGAYIELTALSVFFRNELKSVVSTIEMVGSDRCILTTDSFMEWVPPEPEFLRMFIGRLYTVGVSKKDIVTMVRDNPAKLLGLSVGNIAQKGV